MKIIIRIKKSRSCGYKIEEYKTLIDIYYNEIKMFYSKATMFTTLQLAMLGGVLAGFERLISTPHIFRIGLVFTILFSLVHVLVAKRGCDVNQAIIAIGAEFEANNDFTFLTDVTKYLSKKKTFLNIMNFPSYAILAIHILFLILWVTLLVYFELNFDFLTNTFNQKHL